MPKKNKPPKNRNTFKARVKVNSRGVGFIKNPNFKEDIEIENYFLKSALNGDEVLYVIHPKIKNKPLSGQVIKILKRAKNQFVGTLEESGGGFFLKPDDRKMYRDIFVFPDPSLKNMTDKKVLVKITSWGDNKKNPTGEVKKVFGKKGEHEAEIQSIIFDKGFDSSFLPQIEKEADKIAEEARKNFETEISTRRDFRDILTFTIDPFDAKDFDDAISFKPLGQNSYEIGVHIADVSYYVREGSMLDKEARERSFSIYLVDRTIPMLPEVLSNDLCSLNPDVGRLAFSAVFKVNNQGKVSNRWFGKSVIRSQKRFAYEEAQKVLNAKGGKFFTELDTLNKIAKNLRNERFKKGAIDFDTEEVAFELDKDGKPLRVYKKERLDTHKLVEEFMLLANREVAEFMSKHPGAQKSAFIYRTHDLPDREKIKELSVFLRALGYNLNIDQKGNVSARDLNALFKQMEGKAEESLIKTAAIRSMSKALYSVKNGGHFGLAFQYYTHFTSPIRRYPDLIVHRLLDKRLSKKKISQDEFVKYYKIAAEASEKEIQVAEAERESIKFKQVEYMSEKIGEEMDGVISGITEWGIYVEESKTKAEGLVRVRDMDDDFYELDQKNYQLIGKKTKKKYRLGDKIKVKATNVDLDKKLIDYELI